MDGNKPATAPSSENPSMFQSSSPPAYQDSSYPGSAYLAQPQGYGFPQTFGSRFDQQPYGQPYQQPNQQAYGQPFQWTNQQLNQQPYSVGQEGPVQPTVFTVQPRPYNNQADPVNDYLGYSIFTMLCCCLPLGIIALANSIVTRNGNTSGDRVTAERSSKRALTLNHVSLGFGLLAYISMIIYFVIAFT